MIPVQLTIEGLYSYQDRQTIDFTNLTEAGLFGIFGKVGSGKSSILEAISYVLYGETERLNARDKRSYNMMNLKSNRAFIAFDFYNYEDKLYRATREFKRNSKNFEDIKSPTVVFYEYKNDEWIPLENSDAEKIIGLSYTNFKRTIIIPQGQFKEFLELGEADRTKMMKEIFGLHKFDLQENTAKLNKKNQSALDQLEGQLKGFDMVSQEEIEIIQQQLTQVQSQYNLLSSNLEKENNVFQQLKNTKADVESLENKKALLPQLNIEKEAIDAKKENVDRFEKIHSAFHSLLTEQNRLQNEIQGKEKEITHQTSTLNTLDDQLTTIEHQLSDLQCDFDNLPLKREQENDWFLAVQNIETLEKKKVLKQRMQNGEEAVLKVKETLQLIENDILTNEKKLEKLSLQKTDAELLMQADQWFTQQNHLQQAVYSQEKKVNQQQEQIEKLAENAQLMQLNLLTFDQEYDKFKHEFEAKKQQAEAQKNHLIVQQQMAQYVHELHDGQPCPLCGALDHPEIVTMQDVSIALKNIQNELATNDKNRLYWQEKSQQVDRLRERERIFTAQLQEETAQLNILQNNLKVHELQFVWKEFDRTNPEAFQQIKNASLQHEQQIKQTTEKVSVERKNWQKENAHFETYRTALEDFKNQEIAFDSKIQQNESLFKVLSWTNIASLTSAEAQNQLEELKASNHKVATLYQQFSEQKNQVVSQKTTLLATIHVLQQQVNQLQEAKEKQTSLIADALLKHEIKQLNDVLAVLAQPLNIAEERKIIEDFSVRYQTIHQQIQELETKLATLEWSLDKYEHQQNLVFELNEQLKKITEQRATLDAEQKRLTKAFDEKRTLLEQQNSLQKRAENLKILLNLFKGAGFVQYVSSIYLRQLCDHANERFHRMTRNQLSLQLNEKGDFEIIDYLNEGKSRSVKTLSGGQGFQASLCLALALAESVQSNAKADKNFFFIDEGFGTQDADSVNIVFETLLSLQKENRIVGIISHVEELKERIPVALNITKDEEKGSLIDVIL